MDLGDDLRRSKKGIFFTLIAVTLLTIAVLTYTVAYTYTRQEKAGVIEAKADAMNKFLQEVDNDMENAIYISGFRALIGMIDEVTNTGTYLGNTETEFKSLFLNGTINGQNASVMNNNTFLFWVEKITAEANAMDFVLNITVNDIDVYQEDPWTVGIQVDVNLSLTDNKNIASWERTKNISNTIELIGFEDPWYSVETSGNILKRINRTLYEGNFTTNVSTDNIRSHVDNTLYLNFTGAPSYLMRFEGNYGSSEFGIESLVDKNEVSGSHPCPAETSSVDSIYWECDTSVPVWNVANWSGFRMDNTTGLDNVSRVDLYMMEDHIS
ncbi:hypothetical protein ACFL0V_06785 [Nanoarchaeota archaeon]